MKRSLCLTNALNQLTRLRRRAPTRDRQEIAIRLERGVLAGATQGSMSGEGPADFERCLALASTGNYQDELFNTLTALIGYYLPRAELRQAHELVDSLSARITKDRPWSYPAIASLLGTVTWLEGDFGVAREHLLRALADRSAADPRALEGAWWMVVDPISSAHIFLALTSMVVRRPRPRRCGVGRSQFGAATIWSFPRTPTTGHIPTSWKSGSGWKAARFRRPPRWSPSSAG